VAWTVRFPPVVGAIQAAGMFRLGVAVAPIGAFPGIGELAPAT
jgi:hypothetical protein